MATRSVGGSGDVSAGGQGDGVGDGRFRFCWFPVLLPMSLRCSRRGLLMTLLILWHYTNLWIIAFDVFVETKHDSPEDHH